MNIALNEFSFVVGNLFVIVTASFERIVNRVFISMNCGIGSDGVFNKWDNGSGLCIGYNLRLDAPAALNSTDYSRLVRSTTPTLTLANAANIGFVNFNVAAVVTKSITAFV